MATKHYQVNGVELACHEHGDGPALVLIHGFPLDHQMWEGQIIALSQLFRVIAPDLRGFGKSSLGHGDERGVPMEKYAADVIAALDALDVKEPVVLAGFSMGGYVAWQLALNHQDRLRGLALCDTRAAADNDEARAARLKMAEAARTAGDSSPALAMMPKLLSPSTSNSKPEVVERVRRMIERQSPEAIAAAQHGMSLRPDVRSRLGDIQVPCVAIVGVEDAISSPAEMREIVAALPEASLIEIPDAGHLAPMENCDAVSNALLDFAQSLTVGG